MRAEEKFGPGTPAGGMAAKLPQAMIEWTNVAYQEKKAGGCRHHSVLALVWFPRLAAQYKAGLRPSPYCSACRRRLRCLVAVMLA